MSEKENVSGEDIDWDVYYSYRNSLVQLKEGQQGQFDKSILTLSAGALGLSVIMIGPLSGVGVEIKAIGFLVLSWVSFIVAILLNVSSYFLSASAAEKSILELDAKMKREVFTSNSGNFLDDMTRFSNLASALAFVVGAVILLVFAYRNAIGS